MDLTPKCRLPTPRRTVVAPALPKSNKSVRQVTGALQTTRLWLATA